MDTNEFEIKIDFEPGQGDPARVFKAMSGLIDAFQSLDSHLAESFNVALDASLVLDDVQAGSIKAKFRDLIEGIPDEAMREGEFKKVIGYFLIVAKYKILDWLKDKKEIASRNDVRVLEGELQRIAEETNIKVIPAYSSPSAEALLSDILAVQDSLATLEEGDSATYSFQDKKVRFNRELQISNEIVRDVLTKEVSESTSKRVVKIKKPDYLGKSMWAFQYDGRAIDAKVIDDDWLAKFQSRMLNVKPGDSLRVLLYEEISYGYEGEIVHRYYEIEKVYEVIIPPEQRTINFET